MTDPTFYRVRDFVVGPSNRIAVQCVMDLVREERPMADIVFVSGGQGRGKTSLAAIAEDEFKERWPGKTSLTLSAHSFLPNLLAGGRVLFDGERGQDAIDNADLLIIEDVDLLAGHGSAQWAVARCLYTGQGRRRRILLTSSHTLGEIDVRQFEARLLSHLFGALSAELGVLDREMRGAIIAAKAIEQMPSCKFDRDLVDYLAVRLPSDGRIISGAVSRLCVHAASLREQPCVNLAANVLQDAFRFQSQVSIAEIQKRVAEHFHIPQREMTSARRGRDVARPRQVAMYLAKQLTPKSMPAIGRRFGGRDHTTVIHAVKQITTLCGIDAELDADVRYLKRELSR